ncbi:CPBP family glutamic-type intramembrane protease [Flexithrix dorotheae]|uniref:CPBP family glutamic-type intramembrane protease n=1 Tax=Flexithrix dorotheae TaxID=70993 RepID=UPI00037C19F9|nr:CPBP family glutamic-type intramembrane protease [Flexithrix dorotheae]
MITIFDYLKKHIQASFNWKFFSIWAIFMATLIFIKYCYGIKITFPGENFRLLWGMLFYSIPFIFTIFLVKQFFKPHFSWKSPGFYILSFLIILGLFFNQYTFFYKEFLLLLPTEIHHFFNRIGYNLHVSFFYLAIPALYWFIRGKSENTSFYGLTFKGFKARPYLIMLLIMVPILFWASFQPAFIKTYPLYKMGMAEAYLNISPILTVGVFEFTYILQFIALEIFYRGFIIYSLSPYLKENSVWVMVTVYGLLHFTKPLPECIGSMFGGYVLGVISYYSRSVFGGIIVHVGLALMMDLLAFWQLFSLNL